VLIQSTINILQLSKFYLLRGRDKLDFRAKEKNEFSFSSTSSSAKQIALKFDTQRFNTFFDLEM